MKITIKSDVFNISKRIKNISKNYSIVFNTKTNKYFVCEGNLTIFTIPYTGLDERTIKFVLERNSKNNDEILKEMETYNEKVFDSNKQKIKQSAIESAEKIMRRSER